MCDRKSMIVLFSIILERRSLCVLGLRGMSVCREGAYNSTPTYNPAATFAAQ